MDLSRTTKVVIVSVAVVTVVVKAAGAAAAVVVMVDAFVVVVVVAVVVVVVVVVLVIVYNSIATMCLKDSIDRIFPDLCPDGFVVHKKLCYYMNSTLTSSWGTARSLQM